MASCPSEFTAGQLLVHNTPSPHTITTPMCRRAAEVSKVHGKLSCLMINDLDAGIGHFENTQVGRVLLFLVKRRAA